MNIAGTAIEVDIRNTIKRDQNAFDSASNKLGSVYEYDNATGWFSIAPTSLSGPKFYVPYKLITSIDPHEIFVSASKDELTHNYSSPPKRTTELTGEGAAQAAATTQPSGYDGDTVVVSWKRLGDLRKLISINYQVYTSDLVELGRVREYDAATGLMLLNKGPFSRHDMIVPISVVDSVNEELGYVTLIASKADLERMRPVDLVQTGAQITRER